MAGLSPSDALSRIPPGATMDQLKALASQVAADPANADIILYSAVSDEVRRRCQEATGYSLIDDTDRAAFLSDERFLVAVARAAGITVANPRRAVEKLMQGARLPDSDPDRAAATLANAALFGVEGDEAALQNSFWGEASRAFADAASGQVIVLLGRVAKKVFWAVELPTLLEAEAAGRLPATTINGIPIASLPKNANAALAAIASSAEARAKALSSPPPSAGGGGGAGRAAARITDPVLHPLPGILQPGPGSPDTLIGNLLAWRGVPAAAAAAIQSAKATSDATIKTAEAATLAAAGTPAAPAAKAAEEAAKAAAAAAMGSMISGAAGGADIHVCATPLPLPPHGPGVVIDGSQTVLINGLPACRMGDTIIEAVGPPNKIVMGLPTVLIGG